MVNWVGSCDSIAVVGLRCLPGKAMGSLGDLGSTVAGGRGATAVGTRLPLRRDASGAPVQPHRAALGATGEPGRDRAGGGLLGGYGAARPGSLRTGGRGGAAQPRAAAA